MKGYTKIPNDMLNVSQLSIPARYLYCVLTRHCGKSEWCFPGQITLGKELGISSRHVRNLVKELENIGLLTKQRTGYNKSNTYRLAKTLNSSKKPSSSMDKKPNTPQISSVFPLHEGTLIPPNSTYLIEKDNNTALREGLEKLKKDMIAKGVYPSPSG